MYPPLFKDIILYPNPTTGELFVQSSKFKIQSFEVFDVKMNGLDEIRWDKLDIDLDIESIKHPEKYPLIMKQYVLKDEPTIAAESELKYKTTL